MMAPHRASLNDNRRERGRERGGGADRPILLRHEEMTENDLTAAKVRSRIG